MKVEVSAPFLFVVVCLGIFSTLVVYKVVSMALDDEVFQKKKAKSPETGGYVLYTRDNMDYKEMDETDKMNYAFQLMSYNVHARKELPEGAQELKQVKRMEDLFKVQSPSIVMYRFTAILTFLSFALFIGIAIAWLVSVTFGVHPIKRDTLWNTMLTLAALFSLTFLLEWVQHRTMVKLDAIQSSL